MCEVEGCGGAHYSRGMCKRHYMRSYRHAKQMSRRTVARRHSHAMKVVKDINDESARWELLDYVVHGSETIDAAFSSLAA